MTLGAPDRNVSIAKTKIVDITTGTIALGLLPRIVISVEWGRGRFWWWR